MILLPSFLHFNTPSSCQHEEGTQPLPNDHTICKYMKNTAKSLTHLIELTTPTLNERVYLCIILQYFIVIERHELTVQDSCVCVQVESRTHLKGLPWKHSPSENCNLSLSICQRFIWSTTVEGIMGDCNGETMYGSTISSQGQNN